VFKPVRIISKDMFGNDIYILIEEDVVRKSSMRPASKRIRLLELALDESERLGAVFVDVLLVCVGIIAVAAVRVGGVAVRLDDAGARWRAFEATGTGGELVMSEIVPISLTGTSLRLLLCRFRHCMADRSGCAGLP
jgi:hypothetical protein